MLLEVRQIRVKGSRRPLLKMLKEAEYFIAIKENASSWPGSRGAPCSTSRQRPKKKQMAIRNK